MPYGPAGGGGGGAGDVVGPASSVDNAVALFDGVTGKLLQESPVIIDPATGNTSGINTLAINSLLNISAAGAGQIQFPASENASANANTLDDFEKGTWTPVDSSGAGLSFAGVDASYEKISRLVVARFGLTYPATASAAIALVGGAPFTPDATDGNRQAFNSLSTDASVKYVAPQIGTTTFQFRDAGAGSITNATLSSDVVRGTLIYRT